jgi:hypothetical protein
MEYVFVYYVAFANPVRPVNPERIKCRYMCDFPFLVSFASLNYIKFYLYLRSKSAECWQLNLYIHLK